LHRAPDWGSTLNRQSALQPVYRNKFERNLNMQTFRDFIRKLSFPAAFLILLFLTAGCASSNVKIGQSTTTAVDLKGKNYRMIQAGAEGESYGFRLLGILPFSSPSYAVARQDLYASVKEPLTGRAVALANQMEDRSSLYLILFSIPKVTITADVIEFIDNTAVSTNK
jgi:hypothetical protein